MFVLIIAIAIQIASATVFPWNSPEEAYHVFGPVVDRSSLPSCGGRHMQTRTFEAEAYNLTGDYHILDYNGPCDYRKTNKYFPVWDAGSRPLNAPNDLKFNMSYWSVTKTTNRNDLFRRTVVENAKTDCSYRFVVGTRSSFFNITGKIYWCSGWTRLFFLADITPTRFLYSSYTYITTYADGPISVVEPYADYYKLYGIAKHLAGEDLDKSPIIRPINETHSNQVVKFGPITGFRSFIGILVECKCGAIFRIREGSKMKDLCIVSGQMVESHSNEIVSSRVDDAYILNFPIAQNNTCGIGTFYDVITCNHIGGLCCKPGCNNNDTISSIPKVANRVALDVIQLIVPLNMVRNCSSCDTVQKYNFMDVLKSL